MCFAPINPYIQDAEFQRMRRKKRQEESKKIKEKRSMKL